MRRRVRATRQRPRRSRTRGKSRRRSSSGRTTGYALTSQRTVDRRAVSRVFGPHSDETPELLVPSSLVVQCALPRRGVRGGAVEQRAVRVEQDPSHDYVSSGPLLAVAYWSSRLRSQPVIAWKRALGVAPAPHNSASKKTRRTRSVRDRAPDRRKSSETCVSTVTSAHEECWATSLFVAPPIRSSRMPVWRAVKPHLCCARAAYVDAVGFRSLAIARI